MASVSLLFVEYVRTVNRYNKEYASDLEVIEKTVVPPLADSMWSFDVEQSRLLVSGLMHFDSVVSVEIIDSENESLCSDAKDGIPLHPDSVPVVFYLTVNRGNEKAEVGELIIYQLDIRQNNEVIESFVFNFLNDFILIFIFLLILLLIITRRITRPLVLLANQIMKTRSGAHLSDSFSIPSKKQKYLSEIQEIETSFLTSFRRMDSEIKARKESEKSLTESLKEKKVLLREVHHRVKNNLQIIIGLLNLQQSSISDEKAKEVLSESQHRIYSMRWCMN